MGKPFNKLTPAEVERLVILAEECGEVIQAITKILRHGYKSRHPRKIVGDNRSDLERECGHVRFAMIQLCNAGDLCKDFIHTQADSKAENIKQYLHHADG